MNRDPSTKWCSECESRSTKTNICPECGRIMVNETIQRALSVHIDKFYSPENGKIIFDPFGLADEILAAGVLDPFLLPEYRQEIFEEVTNQPPERICPECSKVTRLERASCPDCGELLVFSDGQPVQYYDPPALHLVLPHSTKVKSPIPPGKTLCRWYREEAIKRGHATISALHFIETGVTRSSGLPNISCDECANAFPEFVETYNKRPSWFGDGELPPAGYRDLIPCRIYLELTREVKE